MTEELKCGRRLWLQTGSSPCKEGPVQQATVLKLGDSTAGGRLWFRESVQSGSVAPWVDIHCNRCFGSLLFQSAFPRRSVRFGVILLPATHTHTYTQTGTQARARTHTHACTRTHTHAGAHARTHTYTHTHMHTHARIHAHRQAHTHTYTFTRVRPPPPPPHKHTQRKKKNKKTHEQMLTNL